MTKKHCAKCGKDTWQNPRRKAKPEDEQPYRCTQCGEPQRFGNLNSKNIVRRMWDGQIKFGPILTDSDKKAFGAVVG